MRGMRRFKGECMKILVLNASPKGDRSATLHTALYLQALYPEHEFSFFAGGTAH